MPLYEYGCYDCGEVSEVLVLGGRPVPASFACRHCGSEDTVKLISLVNYKISKKPKYSEEFLGKALPSFKKRKETAAHFAEGDKSSDEAKMFEMGEKIGKQIDRVLHKHFPKK